MRGKFFLVTRVDEDTGAMSIVNEGRIKQQITPERYLCQFTMGRVFSRVVALDEILDWNLFSSVPQLEEFIQSFAQPKPPGAEKIPVPADELIDETPDDLDQLEDLIDSDELFDDALGQLDKEPCPDGEGS